MSGIVDTHAHLEEIDDLDKVITAAKAADVIAIVTVGSDTQSNQRVLEIAHIYPGFVFPAIGLDPWHIKTTSIENDLEYIRLNVSRTIAIGEIGLDYHKKVLEINDKDIQKRVFSELLKIASSYKKVALVHSRYAWKDCFNLVEGTSVEKAVFHWYTGPSSVLGDILSHGYYISATPAVEYHSDHRRAIRETPLDRLLLETDSPVTYGHGGQGEFKARPADVNRSLEGAAKLKGISITELAQTTTANTIKLFKLSINKPEGPNR
jgi:TatD DNase family protein